MDWEHPCPKCGNDHIIGVEYAYGSEHRYDGVSEYQCSKCMYRVGRWTGMSIPDGFAEPRYGEGGSPVPVVEVEDGE